MLLTAESLVQKGAKRPQYYFKATQKTFKTVPCCLAQLDATLRNKGFISPTGQTFSEDVKFVCLESRLVDLIHFQDET